MGSIRHIPAARLSYYLISTMVACIGIVTIRNRCTFVYSLAARADGRWVFSFPREQWPSAAVDIVSYLPLQPYLQTLRNECCKLFILQIRK